MSRWTFDFVEQTAALWVSRAVRETGNLVEVNGLEDGMFSVVRGAFEIEAQLVGRTPSALFEVLRCYPFVKDARAGSGDWSVTGRLARVAYHGASNRLVLQRVAGDGWVDDISVTWDDVTGDIVEQIATRLIP